MWLARTSDGRLCLCLSVLLFVAVVVNADCSLTDNDGHTVETEHDDFLHSYYCCEDDSTWFTTKCSKCCSYPFWPLVLGVGFAIVLCVVFGCAAANCDPHRELFVRREDAQLLPVTIGEGFTSQRCYRCEQPRDLECERRQCPVHCKTHCDTRCQLRAAFCEGHECVNKQDDACDADMCEGCCSVPHCFAHGDLTLCHKCGVRSLVDYCDYACCDGCCKEDVETWMACEEHSKQCQGCRNHHSRTCDVHKCGRCCVVASCTAHGDASLCKRCEKQQNHTKCEVHRCRSCCNEVCCAAHGDPALCRICKARHYDRACVSRRCNVCCIAPQRKLCSAHALLCRSCNEGVGLVSLSCGKCHRCCSCRDHSQRWFGRFECECGRFWCSAQTYPGWRQQCQGCEKYVQAMQISTLQRGSGTGDKAHDSKRCERCQKGYAC